MKICNLNDVQPEVGIYQDNLSAINYYRLSLSLKIVLIYRLPISLLGYILLLQINYRDKRFLCNCTIAKSDLCW